MERLSILQILEDKQQITIFDDKSEDFEEKKFNLEEFKQKVKSKLD